MDKSQLVSRCGLWCGACRTYLIQKKDLFEEKGYKRGCKGCWIQDKNCAFLKKKCPALRNGKIDYCFECETLPCEHLKNIDDKYREKYNISLIANLKRMKEIGIESWVQEQEKLYQCPECGGEISMHDKECFDCGKKI